MIQLYPDEKILKVVRRHWWILLEKVIAFFLLIWAPLIFYGVLSLTVYFDLLSRSLTPLETTSLFLGLIYFIYVIIIFLFFMINWIYYYLDFWIVTDRRVIGVELVSIFNHELFEFNLDKIQDVSVEIKGFFPTVFGYGNLTLRTASAIASLNIEQAAQPNEIRNLIIGAINNSVQRNDNVSI